MVDLEVEHASAGLGERVWTQLVARKSWTRGTAFNSLQDPSQETPGLTDGLEFVRVIPTDWPAACPDRHREAIHHLSSCLSFSFSFLSQGGSIYWCYSTATNTTATTTHNLQNIHPSITKKNEEEDSPILPHTNPPMCHPSKPTQYSNLIQSKQSITRIAINFPLPTAHKK
ncbi:hypothetical protein BO85DRAFT_451173 [Aspergillus piperis CBS 112811]|uniref:Uncharacterized protein n=1 Tax=Aspergillus piperis CBS 112811 TaxID=1448313 RepID=A0A8G1QYB4_9EURO|nr:hypothetical protein BO85DRAFT_451173 [Aspergillus piperis CBS 112811]RAH55944.1 hypothetical protein BO85DRAFT_451173 [Aspergillus piperis CBS 112811]